MANKIEPHLSRLHPDRKGIELALGDLEAAVMRAVWDAPDAVNVDDVREKLNSQGREMAYTTIMTTLARLQKKGLLDRQLQGRAYFYKPALTQEEFAQTVTRAALDGLLGAFSEPAVAYFVEVLSERDPHQLDLLAEMIERKRREKPE
jgi:predicted transcriptional regulator